MKHHSSRMFSNDSYKFLLIQNKQRIDRVVSSTSYSNTNTRKIFSNVILHFCHKLTSIPLLLEIIYLLQQKGDCPRFLIIFLGRQYFQSVKFPNFFFFMLARFSLFSIGIQHISHNFPNFVTIKYHIILLYLWDEHAKSQKFHQIMHDKWTVFSASYFVSQIFPSFKRGEAA